jgi:hypothetical protein
VVAVVLLFYPTHPLLELQQAEQVALAIYLLAVQAVHQRLQTQAAQAVAVADISPLAVTHQATQVELAEMAGVAVAVPTTLEHQVLAVMAYFIYTTKEINNGNICNDEWQYSFKCNCRRR